MVIHFLNHTIVITEKQFAMVHGMLAIYHEDLVSQGHI
jgi:hypothetical protein